MKRTALFLLCWLFLSSHAFAQSQWSADFKGGHFYPQPDNWSQFYGNDKTSGVAGTMAYKVLPWLEVGGGLGYIHDRGQGQFVLSGSLGGEVVYELYPAQVFVALRGKITEGQWAVPYVAAGLDRVYYRVSVHNQGRRDGSVSGSHVRGGLQLLLDALDRHAFNSISKDMGVEHVWFIMEVQETSAEHDASGTDLGGTAYYAGILFEF